MLGFGPSLSGGAEEVARGRVDIVADDAAFNRALSSMESRFSSTMRSMGRFAKYAGAAVVGGLAIGTAAVVKMGFSFDNMRQQAQIAFTTMLGSGKKATAFLDRLQKFAARTPFEFTDLTRASQRLLAMGFQAKKVIPTLTALGDAAAGLGASKETIDRLTLALGQMQAKGVASGEEMRQLTESGIPAWQYLADVLHTDVAGAMEMVTKRQVEGGVAVKAVIDGMNSDFAGMMEKQSHTWGGLVSTLHDTFAQISGTVMQPFFGMATDGLQQIVDLTSSKKFTQGVTDFAADLERFLNQPKEIKIYMAEQAARRMARRMTEALQDVDWAAVADRADQFFADALNFGTENANAFVEKVIEHKAEMTDFFLAVLKSTFKAATTKGGAEIIGVAIGLAMAKKFLSMLPALLLGRGLGAGGLGGIGTLARPVPVFVTNPGMGGLPGGGGAAGKGPLGKVGGWGGLAGALGRNARFANPELIALAIFEATFGDPNQAEMDDWNKMKAIIKANPGKFPNLNKLFENLASQGRIEGEGAQGVFADLAKGKIGPLQAELRLQMIVEADNPNNRLNDVKEHVDQVTNSILGIPKSTQDAMDRARAPIQEHIDLVRKGFQNTKGDVDKASGSVDRLKQNIQGLRDKHVNIDVGATVTVAGVKFLPSGAIAHHLAEGMATGGIVKAVPGGVYRVAEGGYDEAVLSTDPRYKHRTYEIIGEIVRRLEGRRGLLPGFQSGGIAGVVSRATGYLGGQVASYLAGRMRPMRAYTEAQRMDALNRPYLWGGGHAGFSRNGPWDCSGAVSQVLHAAGYPISAPMVSGALAGWGRAGSSDALEVLANATHTYMRIFDQSYGTSNENPGGGWGGPLSYGERAGFASRIPAFAAGGIVDVSPLRGWRPGQFGVHRRRKGESRRHYLRRLHQIDVGRIPQRMEMARARAALTQRISDDIDAQRKIVRWFRHGRGTGWLSGSQKLTVLQSLRSEADTLEGLLGETKEEQAPRLATLVANLFSQYGGNIFGPGGSIGSTALGAVAAPSLPGGRPPGSGWPSSGGVLSGPRKTVVVNQLFNAPPDDPYPLMRSAQFAADATFGG